MIHIPGVIAAIALIALFPIAPVFAWQNSAIIDLHYLVGHQRLPQSAALLDALCVGWLLALATTLGFLLRVTRRSRLLSKANTAARNSRGMMMRNGR